MQKGRSGKAGRGERWPMNTTRRQTAQEEKNERTNKNVRRKSSVVYRIAPVARIEGGMVPIECVQLFALRAIGQIGMAGGDGPRRIGRGTRRKGQG